MTEEGSPGPFEENPIRSFDKISSKLELEGKTITSQPCETSLFKMDFFIPKSIATIFSLMGLSEYFFLLSKPVSVG